jgi:GR25 family glycosyltransferase involved in LPS biosynthesis
MKVGITANFQFSFFSGGGSSTTIATAELCKKLGHDIYLVNANGTQEWWDDCKNLKAEYPNVLHLENLKNSTGEPPLDILLEVSTLMATAELRRKIARQCIWVVRKPALLHDIENSIYPLTSTKRNLDGLTAIWALDLEVTKDEIEYLEILSKGLPVRHVPFAWSPSAIETHKKEAGTPEWIQVLSYFIQQKGGIPPWSIHICETNTSASSSCTIPLVTLREMKRKSIIPFSNYKIHNAEHIEKNDFFSQNVMKHCQIDGLTATFVGRQRIIDWIYDPASVVFSHVRFRSVRSMFLDTIWCGIPFVHNSQLLSDLGAPYYYTDNSIIEAGAAFSKLHQDLLQGKGMFQTGFLEAMRAKLRSEFTCDSERVVNGWKEAFSSLPAVSAPVLAPVSAPLPMVAIAPKLSTSKKTLNVLFTDMWDGFNPEYNMFLLMMYEGIKYSDKELQILGFTVQTLPSGCVPNVLIFGPFGTEWKKEAWKDIKKVHFTGENTQPQMGDGVVLNLGYAHADFVDESYIRFPLWMIEIDWFGADTEKINNPKPLPVDRCTKVYPGEIVEKTKFCAFVVTNPCNPVRNNAFHWLSQYKKVDSAGRLFNNIGDEIFAGLGGGGGELKKHEFLKKYKFCFAYENSSSPGYTTEKLLHAKAAGCIPIYWGDPKVERDFSSAGFIDARKMSSPDELIQAVKTLDENPSEYLMKLAVPALDDYKRDLVRRTLREVSYGILKAAGIEQNKLDLIPQFIGGKSSEEAVAIGRERNVSFSPPASVPISEPVLAPVTTLKEAPLNKVASISSPLVITYATRNYLSSLQQLLAGITIQKKGIPDIEIQVWLTQDVPEDSRSLLKSNYPDVKFFSPPESEFPQDFPDYWNPQHFAWKCWLLNYVCSSPQYKDRLVLYFDAGVFCCRWPSDMLRLAFEDGVCLLEDPRQINDQWCHDVFKNSLQMTEAEKSAQQIAANIQAFKAGHAAALTFYSQTYNLSKQRALIVGTKWEGLRSGKPYGHRHDQSIMSLLSRRMGLTRYPLDKVYCDVSLRKTFMSGKSFYVHRGQFQIHKQFTQGIDDAYVINLDRRGDRMEKLYTNSPSLEGRLQRVSAIEGRDLVLTPQLARLFKPHDFLWKKAIMGCALSHLGLWWQLANEKQEISNYLILEDDVKLQPQWEERWKEAAAHAPDDYDVIYLGGILPPNRAVFEQIKEPVNPYFARVSPNSVFGQNPPNRYFHWCAYAYVLSKRGAEKILQLLHAHDGYWTSADHIICNHVEHMKLYFLNPLVAGCYQDEDPKYQASAFNDFNRVDGFDSDLWNNDNRFTQEDITNYTAAANGLPINIPEVLSQVQQKVVNKTPVKPSEKQETPPIKDKDIQQLETELPPLWKTYIDEIVVPEKKKSSTVRKVAIQCLQQWQPADWTNIELTVLLASFPSTLTRSSEPQLDPSPMTLQAAIDHWLKMKPSTEEEIKSWRRTLEALTNWKDTPLLISTPPAPRRKRLVCLKQHNLRGPELYEAEWLKHVLGPDVPLHIEHVDLDDSPPVDTPIVFFQKNHIAAYNELLRKWNDSGCDFYILHLSDEYLNDDLSVYSLPMCKGVLRMYERPGMPSIEKVKVIPLGYHFTIDGGSENPAEKTPRLPFRSNRWSFMGTNWQNRQQLLEPFNRIQPNRTVYADSWESAQKIKRKEYLAVLLDSYFVPCPVGNNAETFRIYEALECGCVPLYVRNGENDPLANRLVEEIGILPSSSWSEAAALAEHLLQNIQLLENYRTVVLNRWLAYKKRVAESVKKLLGL